MQQITPFIAVHVCGLLLAVLMNFPHFFLEEMFMDSFSNDEKNLSLAICYWTLHFLCWVVNSFYIS